MQKENNSRGMKFKETLEIAAKCLPLFSVIAYITGFLIFAFYFYKTIAFRGINLFTYLEITDHLTVFGIGALLFLVTSLLLIIFPSFIYDKLVKSKKENVGYWKSFMYFAILLSIVGTPFIAVLSSSIYPKIFSLEWFLIIFLILLPVTISSAFVYRQNKTAVIMSLLIIPVLLVIWYPQITIDFAGYGNYWACLTLTTSEGQSLIMNPKFKDLIRCSNDGFWYTPEQVFIPLQLRDYIFIANMTKDNAKVEEVEIISKKEAHVFQVTTAKSKSCNISKEKTT